MTQLYLIAHKVSGELAFDVATTIECPLCCNGHVSDSLGNPVMCSECGGRARWYIIPTSGHRAYPYSIMGLFNGIPTEVWLGELPNMPPGLPDHYPTSASPDKPKLNLAGLLPKPAPIRRRV